MAKITKISAQKRGDRVNIYLDDAFGFGITQNALVENGLFIGKELTVKEIEFLESSDQISKCLDKAYRFLSYRPRSEKEMRDKLSERFDKTTVNKAVTKLKKLKYINDRNFTDFWIENRSNSRGPALLQSELISKGIDREIIREAISKIDRQDVTARALALVVSKRKYHNLDRRELYQKVAPYLARRGFDYDIIRSVIGKLQDK